MAGHSAAGHETYYVPESSKFAVSATIGLVSTLIGAAGILNHMSFHPETESNSYYVFYVGLLWFLATLFVWFSAAIKENLAGKNSAQLKHSYVIGMQWFIFSEVMFFFAFFGALFYVRNLAGPWLGSEGDHGPASLIWGDFKYSWPLMETPQQAVGGVANQYIANNGEFAGPKNNLSFPGWSNMLHWLPLWNTVVLLTSSFTCHIAHKAILDNNKSKFNFWLLTTVVLGFIFVYLQYLEYHEAIFEYGLTLKSGIYGTTFFMLTGFHGFHVCMGAIMLLIQLIRSTKAGHFDKKDHFGFEASSWYWHFVDVVWVGLFLFVYIM
jgi:cytochrome c oxidase subunit 3